MKSIFKTKTIILLAAANIVGVISCTDKFLELPPTGQIAESNLESLQGVDGLLIGAYSSLNGRSTGGWFSGATNWLWGSIRGGDANKGTNAGDFGSMNPIQRFELDPVNGEPNSKWSGSYEGIARANAALAYLLKAKDVKDADKLRLEGEARFLRGHYYFELKKTFNNVPWIDETMEISAGTPQKVTNTVDIWPLIEADFLTGYNNLPETQAQIGRANKWAAGAYLGKTYVYQKKWTEAKKVFDDVIANGKTSNGKKYGLVPNFANIFRGANENNEESIFAFQAAAGTGSVDNTNIETAMNYPYNTGPAGPGECCGFFAPSFELASSYRTQDGRPLLDESYRQPGKELKTDMGVLSKDAFTPDLGPVDPRLDLTIGRRGIMFLDWMVHPGFDWIRDQSYAGPFTQKKLSYQKGEKGTYQDGSSWTPGYQAINFMIIRFADVLLLAAETEIELENLDKGLQYINQVRERAANSTLVDERVKYEISPYPAFSGKEQAMQALQFERKLELALEGHRFFDLVRWGIAEREINEYLRYEGAKLQTALGGSTFVGGKHEYLPIPQRQIDLQGRDVLQQNPGY